LYRASFDCCGQGQPQLALAELLCSWAHLQPQHRRPALAFALTLAKDEVLLLQKNLLTVHLSEQLLNLLLRQVPQRPKLLAFRGLDSEIAFRPSTTRGIAELGSGDPMWQEHVGQLQELLGLLRVVTSKDSINDILPRHMAPSRLPLSPILCSAATI